MNTILLVDKPKTWTSFDVVAKIRSGIKAGFAAKGEKPTKRQLKVGHAGTLDPFATGLLIILTGDKCSEADKFLKLNKTYEFTARLGQVSSTGDPEGELKEVSRETPSKAQVAEALEKFIGEIEQTPPAYSAIKVNGQRAYKLARAGKEVKLTPRKVQIHQLELLDYNYPELKCSVSVSSGTYIRTLVEDIGRKLATGAYCTELRRTRIGKYYADDAVSVNEAAAAKLLD